MVERPRGTVTFLFTDIEGSTRLWERDHAAMGAAVHRHFELLDAAISAHGGVRFKTIGDAIQAAFAEAPAAVAAASDVQRALAAEAWGSTGPLRVRMALHVGEAAPDVLGDYLAPCLNRLARLLATGWGGQVLVSEAVQQLVRPALPPGVALKDLGKHRLRDLLEPERVAQLSIDELPDHFPPLKSLERHPTNLPIQPSELIGRERELGQLRTLLIGNGAPPARLVTLSGPGGIGKTRLALQVAAELVDAFEDGVFLVDLAPITDPGLVLSVIAATLGVRESGDRSLHDALTAYLNGKRLLFVLDNFEQIGDAAPLVADLLAECEGLAVLTTSREPLKVRSEREYPVASLPPPDLTRLPPPSRLIENPAVRLFVERARAIKPDFALDAGNAAAIASITARLDGLPLAIELAAARVRVLPPARLLARLDNRLSMLTGGARDLPTRQQTMRNTIAWSYDLLIPSEQGLFDRLAVFAGGFTLEAAETICTAVAGPAGDILDGVDSLIQKSLLKTDDALDAEPRFAMLQTIREFGLERLQEEGLLTDARLAHSGFYRTLADEAKAEPEESVWLERVGCEHDNLRAALSSLAEQGDGQTLLDLATSLWGFWFVRGHLTEGREWLERALAAAADAPPALRAEALNGAGGLAEELGDHERAALFYQEALEIYDALDDRNGRAVTLDNLGKIAVERDDLDQGRELYERAVALSRELGDTPSIVTSLNNLGMLAVTEGQFDRAGVQLEEALALAREEGDEWLIANSLVNLGDAAREQGDLDRAESSFREALSIFQTLGDDEGVAFCVEGFAHLAALRGHLDQAVRLFSAVSVYFESHGRPMARLHRVQHERTIARLRARVGEEQFALVWTAAQSLSLPEAIAVSSPDQPAAQPDGADPHS